MFLISFKINFYVSEVSGRQQSRDYGQHKLDLDLMDGEKKGHKVGWGGEGDGSGRSWGGG